MTSTSASAESGGPGPRRRMRARRRDEAHRAATPLELFFDLCFVVAVNQAGLQLVHAVAENHAGHGVLSYAMVFFAIWWAWMNFTWFASAYDTDDIPYRLVTLIQIAGVLILAAGVARAFLDQDFVVVFVGYVVMRIALVGQWLRVAASTRGAERTTALRYAGGIVLCQIGWLALLVLPTHVRPWAFLVLALAEMAVPLIAERSMATSWHAHHIAERYGLFTIIVLGETILAATVGVRSALDVSNALGVLVPIAVGGLLIVFAAWWIYFAVPVHVRLEAGDEAFLWGYGHYVIFACAAAIGAGLEVAVETAVHKSHISEVAAAAAVTVPTAAFLLTVWLLHARHFKHGLWQQLLLPCSALVILLCTLAGEHAVLAAGLVAAATVATGETLTRRAGRPGPRATAGAPAG
ncbi:low temperature requirement protein A [Streptomyces sp. NBC_01619]|uniref:low temperature requirement protein A n=1 Tax=unclassified Streptomyces TaxID=2593676 RepID=UPI00225631DF|nr:MULTISPECIES: low temperature requirement protein A [unclassified Streptomyces]MCX4511447.1 low temperature requirement protein A [Streptomyces sp. NBC_01619]